MKPGYVLFLSLVATPLLAHEPEGATGTQGNDMEMMAGMCASMHAKMKDMTAEQMKKHMEMMRGKGMMCGEADSQVQHSTSGTVTELDAQARKLTVAHEPVPSLNWPAMTMTFEVDDETELDGLHVGDEIGFSFAQQDDLYVISDIEDR